MEKKRGEGNKDFKKGSKLGQGVGALKGGAYNPLTNYALSFHTVFQVFKVLRNLLDSYSCIFVKNFNVFTRTPTPKPPS